MKPTFQANFNSTSTHEGLPNPRKATAEHLLRIGVVIGLVSLAGIIILYFRYPFEQIGKLISSPTDIGTAEVTAIGCFLLLASLLFSAGKTIVAALGDRVDRIYGKGPSPDFFSLSHVVSAMQDPAKARLSFSKPLSFILAGGGWEDKSARLSPNQKLIAMSLIKVTKSTGTLALLLFGGWASLLVISAIAKGANPELGQRLSALASSSLPWMTALAATIATFMLVLAIRGIVQSEFLSDPVTRLTDSMSGKLDPELLTAWMRRATDHLASADQPNRVHVLSGEAIGQVLTSERASIQAAIFVESPVAVNQPAMQPHAQRLLMWGAAMLIGAGLVAIATSLFRPQNGWLVANLLGSALVFAIVGNCLFRSGDLLLSLWRFSSSVVVLNAVGVATQSTLDLGSSFRDERAHKKVFDGDLVVRLFAAQVVSESLPLGKPRDLVGFEAAKLDSSAVARVIDQLRSQITATTSFVTADRASSAPLHVLNQALSNGPKTLLPGVDSSGGPVALFAPAPTPSIPVPSPTAPQPTPADPPVQPSQISSQTPVGVEKTLDLLDQLLADCKNGKLTHALPTALIESKVMVSRSKLQLGEPADVVTRELLEIMSGFKPA